MNGRLRCFDHANGPGRATRRFDFTVTVEKTGPVAPTEPVALTGIGREEG